MKKKIIFIAFSTFLIDQALKFMANVFLYKSIVIIPNFLKLSYAKNTGVAFSFLSGNKMFIIVISLLLILMLLYVVNKEYLQKHQNHFYKNLGYGIMFGGIIGNLFDRVVRGFVIDYISLNIFGYNFPIFNLADMLIIIGVLIIMFFSIKEEVKHEIRYR